MSQGQAQVCEPPEPRGSAPGPLPAILVTGITQAARQRAIDSLIDLKPESQRWIVVASGLVARHASAGRRPADVEFAVLPPGCLCCTGLLPFKVGLTRLLRRLSTWAPARLIIDAGTESHAAGVRTELKKPAFAGLLRLETTIAAVDANSIDSAARAQRRALGDLCAAADLVICEAGATIVSDNGYARFRAESGVTAPILSATDPACAVYLGLRIGPAPV